MDAKQNIAEYIVKILKTFFFNILNIFEIYFFLLFNCVYAHVLNLNNKKYLDIKENRIWAFQGTEPPRTPYATYVSRNLNRLCCLAHSSIRLNFSVYGIIVDILW